jgi:uncharacterized membrane protein
VGGVKRIATIFISAVFVAYPVLIYYGLTAFSPTAVGIFILAMLGVRMAVVMKLSFQKLKPLLPLTMAAALPSVYSLLFNSERALLLTPVLVNVALLGTFGWTLLRGPSMVARFAALKEPTMTDAILTYCKKVTVVWCGFFIVNGSIATYTALYTSKEYWTLYNGLISYILMGLLFSVEFMVRKTVKQKG